MELLTREAALERLASVDWQPRPLLDMLLLAQAEALEWAVNQRSSEGAIIFVVLLEQAARLRKAAE